MGDYYIVYVEPQNGTVVKQFELSCSYDEVGTDSYLQEYMEERFIKFFEEGLQDIWPSDTLIDVDLKDAGLRRLPWRYSEDTPLEEIMLDKDVAENGGIIRIQVSFSMDKEKSAEKIFESICFQREVLPGWLCLVYIEPDEEGTNTRYLIEDIPEIEGVEMIWQNGRALLR